MAATVMEIGRKINIAPRRMQKGCSNPVKLFWYVHDVVWYCCICLWNFTNGRRYNGNSKKKNTHVLQNAPNFLKIYLNLTWHGQNCYLVFEFSKWLPLPSKQQKFQNATNFMKLFKNVNLHAKICFLALEFFKWLLLLWQWGTRVPFVNIAITKLI